jgi:hypothetical protein
MKKMYRTFLVAIASAVVFVAACNPEKGQEEIPAEIIPPDSMVQLLADIHIAESRLLLTGAGQDARLPKSAYIHQVLQSRNIDTVAFNRSFEFYSNHPAIFEKVYEGVTEEIGKRQAEQGAVEIPK